MSLRSNANKKQFPDCIPGGAQCNSGELVDEGACRNPLTTDVNTNCDATAYIAGNTDGSACRLPLTTDVNANCDGTAYIAGNTDGSACRVPLTTDVNANCDGTAYIAGNTDGSACRLPLTTDVNANCDGTAYIAGNTDGSACRLPLTTDVNANCDANKFIGTSTDGTTCADPLVTNADSTCATSSLVKDVAGTGDGNACTSACTNGQGVDTSSTPECKDIEATLSCDDCVPNGGTCSIQVSDTRTFDGGTGADFTASDCDTVCGASGGAIGQCDITIAFATS